ncbi:hypothetical protein TWF718_001053 [Orbilia javanica]|uniref:F-box domain-containing protein n=1 Tax=Orbilia javanica TaxID=47235 RepID=A0AAN8N517_9PEZI
MDMSTIDEGRPLLSMDFPPEIHYGVLESADVSEYSALRLVCKTWYNFIENTLPLGRYVPAKIEFKKEPPEDPMEPPSLGLCIDPSLWLVHRGTLIFSTFRMDPKLLDLKRITGAVDFVNSTITSRIENTGVDTEVIDNAAMGGYIRYDVPRIGNSRLLCGTRDISHYLTDPVYAINPNHPECKKYNGYVEILQFWKFVPGPRVYEPRSQPSRTIRKWMELFLDRYDWEKFDEALENSRRPHGGIYTPSIEIEARVEAPSTGSWKQIKTMEHKGRDIDMFCLEITTTAFVIGCRFRSGEDWSVAGRSSPTGFTFGKQE